jgi:DNA invertase Pin-like site-specific DNA recombinase
VVIIGAVAELERNLIIERVRAGIQRERCQRQSLPRSRRATRSRRLQFNVCCGRIRRRQPEPDQIAPNMA